MLTAFGVLSLTFVMTMYALERRHRFFILAFALGCVLASPTTASFACKQARLGQDPGVVADRRLRLAQLHGRVAT